MSKKFKISDQACIAVSRVMTYHCNYIPPNSSAKSLGVIGAMIDINHYTCLLNPLPRGKHDVPPEIKTKVVAMAEYETWLSRGDR